MLFVVLKKDENQRFQQFTDMLNESERKKQTLKLIGFAEFEKNKVVEAVAIDASLKEEIQNSKNLCILTYPRNDVLASFTAGAIVKLGDGKSEKGCDDSKVEPGHSENLCDDSEFTSDFLDEAKDKELIELLDNSKAYVFVFSY